MGEGLKKIVDEIHSSYRAEDEEDLGEASDSNSNCDSGSDTGSGGESDGCCFAPSPRKQFSISPAPYCFDSEGVLYDLSSLVDQLPLKKGLSKYYQGKSQSFTSLSGVNSLEDLPKKTEVSPTIKIKPCRSYAGLEQANIFVYSSLETRRKPVPKKAPPPVASCSSSMARSGGGSTNTGFLTRGCRPPPVPVQKRL